MLFIRKSKAEISKEKDRAENLLLNILPEEVARELKEKGKATARKYEKVSILFTDFKEFTQVASNLSPETLVGELNKFFMVFDAVCDKYKIEKIKTIGDAYMAAGGLPLPLDISVKNTVLAALEMTRFVAERKETPKLFEMRAGIHTGPVVAGIVGVRKFQYDVWGDTVNIASRMESAGEPGRVNISKTTYDLIRDDPDFTFEYRGCIEAKGKGKVEMYFVSLKKDAEGIQGNPGYNHAGSVT
jgi:class 3 adenylate cyclase